MNDLQPLLGKRVELKISGKQLNVKGILYDVGNDICVVYNEKQFYYLPFLHVQSIKLAQYDQNDPNEGAPPTSSPFDEQIVGLTFRKVLLNAKGIFLELYIIGHQSIYGYITSIMNDYFVFYSPVFHTLIIPLQHLKYLIPYNSNTTPYSLSQEHFLLNPSNLTLARSFDQQMKKLEGKLVVMDLGENTNKIGLIKQVVNNRIELITANEESVYVHMDHIKTVHMP